MRRVTAVALAGLLAIGGYGTADVLDLAPGILTLAPEVAAYIVDIGRATRQSPSLSLGVSPRGATALLATSRAWAWMNGRTFVTPDDVKALAHATLAHRLTLRPEAELEGVGVRLGQLLEQERVIAAARGGRGGP